MCILLIQGPQLQTPSSECEDHGSVLYGSYYGQVIMRSLVFDYLNFTSLSLSSQYSEFILLITDFDVCNRPYQSARYLVSRRLILILNFAGLRSKAVKWTTTSARQVPAFLCVIR